MILSTDRLDLQILKSEMQSYMTILQPLLDVGQVKSLGNFQRAQI